MSLRIWKLVFEFNCFAALWLIGFEKVRKVMLKRPELRGSEDNYGAPYLVLLGPLLVTLRLSLLPWTESYNALCHWSFALCYWSFSVTSSSFFFCLFVSSICRSICTRILTYSSIYRSYFRSFKYETWIAAGCIKKNVP